MVLAIVFGCFAVRIIALLAGVVLGAIVGALTGGARGLASVPRAHPARRDPCLEALAITVDNSAKAQQARISWRSAAGTFIAEGHRSNVATITRAVKQRHRVVALHRAQRTIGIAPPVVADSLDNRISAGSLVSCGEAKRALRCQAYGVTLSVSDTAHVFSAPRSCATAAS